MSHLRSLPPTAAVLALLLMGCPMHAEEEPPLLPTRDVDITYDVTRPQQPKIRERVRWSASQHLERIDGPDKSTTIFDHAAQEITLLVPKSRSYRKLEGKPRRPPEPETGAVLKRGNESVVAGLHCVDWSWTADVETHTVCMTPDGVLLRLMIDGQTVMQAHSVRYGAQSADLFQIPRDYSPALAPEGSTGL
jgi:hypothetical protein